MERGVERIVLPVSPKNSQRKRESRAKSKNFRELFRRYLASNVLGEGCAYCGNHPALDNCDFLLEMIARAVTWMWSSQDCIGQCLDLLLPSACILTVCWETHHSMNLYRFVLTVASGMRLSFLFLPRP